MAVGTAAQEDDPPLREKVEHLPNVRDLNMLLLLNIFEGVQDGHLLSVDHLRLGVTTFPMTDGQVAARTAGRALTKDKLTCVGLGFHAGHATLEGLQAMRAATRLFHAGHIPWLLATFPNA